MSKLGRAAIFAHHRLLVAALQAPPPDFQLAGLIPSNLKPLGYVTQHYWKVGFPRSARRRRAVA